MPTEIEKESETKNQLRTFSAHLDQQWVNKERDRLILEIADNQNYDGYVRDNYPSFYKNTIAALKP